ncbi:MAG: MBL fold metallo-hydrolase [Deltaproteobacteria bacterium]|nr:MBL fold metallo-hydrolase [Deltaproteobacteria bacterium]
MSAVEEPIEILRLTNERFGSCCYIVASSPGARRAVVVDPGVPYETIRTVLRRRKLAVDFVILTHEHFDHMSGAGELCAGEGAKLVASKECAESVTDPARNMSKYSGLGEVALRSVDVVIAGDRGDLAWEGLALEMFRTPGHTPGSMCLRIGPALFTGDALIKDIKTVTRLPGGDKRLSRRSIRWLLDTFPGRTKVYPGHGEPFELREASRWAEL